MKKNVNIELEKDAHAARAAGLSYGYFKAKEYISELWKTDTITCIDKVEAIAVADEVGFIHVKDWKDNKDGSVTLIMRKGWKK